MCEEENAVFLRESMFKADCDRCGVRFDPIEGGFCASCGEALCAAHLHGSLVQRLKVSLLGRTSVCTACRAAGAKPTVTAGVAR